MLKRILTALMLLVVVFATLLGLRQVYVELADLVGVLICGLGVFEMANAFKKEIGRASCRERVSSPV